MLYRTQEIFNLKKDFQTQICLYQPNHVSEHTKTNISLWMGSMLKLVPSQFTLQNISREKMALKMNKTQI